MINSYKKYDKALERIEVIFDAPPDPIEAYKADLGILIYLIAAIIAF